MLIIIWKHRIKIKKEWFHKSNQYMCNKAKANPNATTSN